MTPDQRVKHEQARLEAVFGRGFKALPLVRPKDAAELGAAFGRSDKLLGGEPLEALSWLQGVSRVRPGASRLSGALTYAAALRRNVGARAEGRAAPVRRRRALGRAAGDERRAAGAAARQALARRPPAAGVRARRSRSPGSCSTSGSSSCPASEVTTGVSFNYDAPGARPPQTVLLAVAPPGPERWQVETLEQILLETLELAQLRAVDPQSLGGDAAAPARAAGAVRDGQRRR